MTETYQSGQVHLLAALAAGQAWSLPWRDVPVAHAATDRGHGRIETRTIQREGNSTRSDAR